MRQFWSFRLWTRRTTSHATASETASLQEPSPSKCYGSIDELPLRIFIDCLTKQDYSGLILEGEPDTEQIGAAWLHLYSEFHERIGDMQTEVLLGKKRQIDELSSRLRRLNCLLIIASSVACEEIAEALQAEGFALDIEADEEDYFRQLRVVNARLKPESIRLDRLRAEMDNPDEAKRATPESFVSTLMDISHFEGFRIRVQDVTTGEYCAYLCRLRDHIEKQRAAAQQKPQ